MPKSNLSLKRRRFFIISTSLFGVLILGYLLYWWLYSRNYESTEDAYVQGDLIQVSSQINGQIKSIYVDNTQTVSANQALIRLDDTDAQIQFEKAKTHLAEVTREVSSLYANTQALKAQLLAQQTQANRAKVLQTEAQANYQRRRQLLDQGAISSEELSQSHTNLQSAKSQYDTALATVEATREQYKSSQVMVQGTTISQHPQVKQAAVALKDAYINLQRTLIKAPTSGQVSKRTAQVGQRISAGTPLLTIVPLDTVWVDANFKENQLRHMRIGQRVTLKADIYGDDVEFQGKIAGINAGTGGAFALLPAQNASGNWIKVVQRVPVRIQLDPKQLKKHPLRIGLSMTATVDLRDQSGAVIGSLPSTSKHQVDPSEHQWQAEIDQLIQQTIQEHTY